MIIMCDVDAVLNDLMPKTLALYNSRNGTNIKLNDLTSYNFADCLSTKDAFGISELFNEKNLWESLEPISDSQWGIKTLLNMGHYIVLATATHEVNFAWKCDWIKTHFPMVDNKNIIRIQDKSLIRADIIIDDCMEQLTNSFCDRICLDYPWNRDKDKDYAYDIYRAYNWKDIINFVNEIERRNKEW